MVTREQALTTNEFHHNGCVRDYGPRGGEKDHIERWRRSGATQTWKTHPLWFRLPIKFGLYHSSVITHDNAQHFHVISECPLLDLDPAESEEQVEAPPEYTAPSHRRYARGRGHNW